MKVKARLKAELEKKGKLSSLWHFASTGVRQWDLYIPKKPHCQSAKDRRTAISILAGHYQLSILEAAAIMSLYRTAVRRREAWPPQPKTEVAVRKPPVLKLAS